MQYKICTYMYHKFYIDPSTTKKIRAHINAVINNLYADARYICKCDPASIDVRQVITTYCTFRAIICYRLAHMLHTLGYPRHARHISQFAHQYYSIDIHPAANIGCPLCIDHGLGLVIGETSTIGSYCNIFHGVTIGAKVVGNHMRNTKRHPTIGNHVTIYSHATILGGDTVIGDYCIIGCNAVVTRTLQPHTIKKATQA